MINKQPSRWRYFFILLLVLLSGGMLAYTIWQGTGIDVTTYFDKIRSEIIIIFYIFALFLLIYLGKLRRVVKKRRRIKSSELDRIHIRGERVVDPVVFVVKPPPIPGTDTPAESDKQDDQDSGRERFYMLSQLDKVEQETAEYDTTITLNEFCENFRNFSASKLKLYYDISDIRHFVAGLSVTKIVVMQGMSGTGKTSLAYAFGEFVSNKSTIVPIQPMWKERTDLIGYYNEFTKKFNETILLQKLYEANSSQDIFVTVLDEMNIARVEYYFAEFLSLLEIPNVKQRHLDVVSDKWDNDPVLLVNGRINLPPNMWFIGTANNDDSTFAISDKVYDRAMVMNLDKKARVFEAPAVEPMRITAEHLENLFTLARQEYKITQRSLSRIAQLDSYMIEKFHLTFGNRIMKQIVNYIPVCLACGGDELDAIDDILSKKVLRKLEAQNPIYVKKYAPEVSAYLEELFGKDTMPQCRSYLLHLERSA